MKFTNSKGGKGLSKIVIELDPSHELLALLDKVIKAHMRDERGLTSSEFITYLIEKGLEN